MRNPRRVRPDEELSTRVARVLATVHRLRRGEHLLVGVSGGPDSMVLLHMLTRLAGNWPVTLAVVHVNHQLRPEASEDAALVERTAHRWKIPVTVVARAVHQNGRSLEDAARDVRYHVFEEAARQAGASRIILAHTADDQAETVLMRLLRGSGLTGLSGIPPSRQLGDAELIRPLLTVWRSEVLTYAAEHRVAFCHDRTNDDPQFLRNRIRHQLLPLLERDYNPQLKAQLVQLAQQCRTDEAWLQASAKRHWKRLVKPRPDGVAIRLEGWREQPLAVQQHLLRLAIAHVKGDLQAIEYRHWREVQDLADNRPEGSVLHLPDDLELEKTADALVLRLPLVENHGILGVS